MKKVFLTLAVIYTVGTANNLNAQIAMNDGKSFTSFVSNSVLSNTGENISAKSVNPLAVQDFKKRFSTAENEIWTKASGNGFMVSFSNDAVQNRVVYGKKGNWAYTILDYNEDKLPEDVKAPIKFAYDTYTITRVHEVHVDGKVIYLVHINDDSTSKIIRVCDEDMEVIENLIKK